MSTSSGDDGKSEVRSKGSSILAPSKFSLGSRGGPGGFSGLKASKFNFGSLGISTKPKDEEENDSQKKEEESKNGGDSALEEAKSAASPSLGAVSFLPLSKSSGQEHPGSPGSRLQGEETPGKLGFTFGENVESRVEHGSTFTFGQNLKDRVSNNESTEEKEESKREEEEEQKDEKPVAGADQSSNYFKALSDSPSVESAKNGGKTLSEAAADYEESHAVKRKYEEVAVKTGEEDECNVVQLPAKLHSFDNAKRNWSEKGRGILRLNDMEDASRLVMRSVGVLKVILNTKLFAGMSWERPSEKSIRFSGADDEGTVKVFLLTGSSKDMERLYQLTKTRISSLQKAKKTKHDGDASD